MKTDTVHQEDSDDLDVADDSSMSEVGRRLHEIDQRTRELVVEHPFIAVGIAVGVGYLIGRVVSRW